MKIAKKILALTLVFDFFVGQLPNGLYAYEVPAAENSVSGFPGIDPLLIPRNLAEIEEVYIAPRITSQPSPVVIHIKDAHSNYAAQKTIQQILRVLYRDGFRQIAVEGAAAKLDRKYLQFFSEAERNMKVADYLAQKGEVSGVDLFILEQENAEAFGIENVEDYASNLDAFRGVMEHREEAENFLSYLEGQIELVMPRLLGKNLLKLVRLWKGFNVQESELLTYVSILSKEAQRSIQLDLSKIASQIEWPQLWRILKLKELEPKLDSKTIQKEQEKIIPFFKEIKADSELIAQMEKLKVGQPLMHDSSWTARLLHERMVQAGSTQGFDFKNYPAYSLYAQYTILQSEVNAAELFEEMKKLSDRLLESLAGKQEEKQIVAFIRDLRMLKKLLGLEMLRDEVRKFKEKKAELSPRAMSARLNHLKEIAKVANHKQDITPTVDILEPLMLQIERFYDLAEKRDEVLISNTLKVIRDTNTDKVVMVTGGYHTEGIKEKLKREGVSYIIVAPRINTLDSKNNYLDVMMDHTKTLFDVAHLPRANLTVPSDVYANEVGPNSAARRSLVLMDAVLRANPTVESLRGAITRHPDLAGYQVALHSQANVPMDVTITSPRGIVLTFPVRAVNQTQEPITKTGYRIAVQQFEEPIAYDVAADLGKPDFALSQLVKIQLAIEQQAIPTLIAEAMKLAAPQGVILSQEDLSRIAFSIPPGNRTDFIAAIQKTVALTSPRNKSVGVSPTLPGISNPPNLPALREALETLRTYIVQLQPSALPPVTAELLGRIERAIKQNDLPTLVFEVQALISPTGKLIAPEIIAQIAVGVPPELRFRLAQVLNQAVTTLKPLATVPRLPAAIQNQLLPRATIERVIGSLEKLTGSIPIGVTATQLTTLREAAQQPAVPALVSAVNVLVAPTGEIVNPEILSQVAFQTPPELQPELISVLKTAAEVLKGVQAPAFPKSAVSQSELIGVLEKLIALVPVLPTVARIVEVTKTLQETPVKPEAVVSLLQILANPRIAGPNLAAQTNLAALPPEVISALNGLIQAAQKIFQSPEVAKQIPATVQGVSVSVTPEKLTNLLNEIQSQIRVVPSVAQITTVIQLLQKTPVAPETLVSLTALLNNPNVPAKLNIGAAEAFQKLIQTALTANLPLELQERLKEAAKQISAVPGVEAIVALTEELKKTPVAPETLVSLTALLNNPNVPAKLNIGAAEAFQKLIKTALTVNLPLELQGQLNEVAKQISAVPSVIGRLVEGFQKIVALIAQVQEGIAQVRAVQTQNIQRQLVEPLQNRIADLNRAIVLFQSTVQLLPRTPELVQAVVTLQGASLGSIPNLVAFEEGLTPRALVEPQVSGLQTAVNNLGITFAQFQTPVQQLAATTTTGSNASFTLTSINVQANRAPERFPSTVLTFSTSTVVETVVQLNRRSSERKESPAHLLAGVTLTQAVQPNTFTTAVQPVILAASIEGFNPHQGTGVIPGIPAATVSELTTILQEAYGNYYQVNNKDAGAVVYYFGGLLPTQEQLLWIVGPQLFNTKAYTRIVVDEGVDQAKVASLSQWVRSQLDVNGNPLGDRIAFALAPQGQAADFIGSLHIYRGPGVERTLFELVRSAAPDQIQNQAGFFNHTVVYVVGTDARSVLQNITRLPDSAWRVYPAAQARFLKNLAYTALKLLLAAITRNQLPDTDQREFQFQRESGLRRFLPNANELAKVLSTMIQGLRRLVTAA